MSGFGQRTYGNATGRVVKIEASSGAIRKVGGVTVDWSSVAAVNADTTLSDGTVVKAGDKYIRYGTTLCCITAAGATFGMYAPFNTGGSAGADSLRRGECFLLNNTIVQSQDHSDNPDVLNGGPVYKARVLASAGGNATTPTFAALETAMPLVEWVGA